MTKNVALVLSGGGARGLAHIGVITELERQGFNITSVAGTSMGAVVGGLYASGRLEWYTAWMQKLDKLKVFNLFDFTLSKSGLMRGDKVFREMKKVIPDTNIEDMRIPFAANAVDILKQEEVIFKKGSLYQAMRASSAIPVFMSPVKTKDQVLVDGGVLNNIPVHIVKRKKGDLLVVVNVNSKEKFTHPKSISSADVSAYKKKTEFFQKELKRVIGRKSSELNYFKIIAKTLDTMMYANLDTLFKKYPPDIIINIPKKSCNIFDFYKIDQMRELGRIATKKSLRKFNQSA